MATIKELLARQAAENIEPKVKRLLERIGRIEPSYQMRLVSMNQQLKDGKTLGKNDIDLVNRLHNSLS